MVTIMSALSVTLTGPRLYYRYSWDNVPSCKYVPNTTEEWADRVIWFLRYYWLIPVLAYRYHFQDYNYRLGFYGAYWLLAMSLGYVARAVGRSNNLEYQRFAIAWEHAHEVATNKSTWVPRNGMKIFPLSIYDYEFSFRPVDYKCTERCIKLKSTFDYAFGEFAIEDTLYSILAACIGRPMMYPGSTNMVQRMMPDFATSRAALVEGCGGKRCKIVTVDGFAVDAMVFDRRVSHANIKTSSKLVITCEGNASFYEQSMGQTMLALNYSVLGWNHLGFGHSEGMPYPENEANAIVAVIKYAIDILGFPMEDIMIFSWSIGCYAASRAGAHFPNLGGLVLDAAFDHVLPLAIPRMPAYLSGLVDSTIRAYLNLDVVSGIRHYAGPIRLFRRLKDEMICEDVRDLRSNRGNTLLVALLMQRYPGLIEKQTLYRYLEHPIRPVTAADTEDKDVQALLRASHGKAQTFYGQTLSDEVRTKLSLYLVSVYLTDIPGSHCVPLPPDYWSEPWKQ